MDRPRIRIAYLILCHKHPDQVIRLIERLRDSDSVFVLHVDKRATEEVFRPLREFAMNEASVRLSKRHRCYWGRFEIVQATLDCIRELIELNQPFDYAFLLSGQDYPLKNNVWIKSFLEKNRGKEFIESFSLSEPNRWSKHAGVFNALNRIRYLTFFFRSRRFHFKTERRPPFDWQPHGGSQWWCLSSECISYIHKFVQQHRSFVRFFRRAFIPDELMFQSILAGSPFNQRIANDDLRFIDWENPNPNVPRILELVDLERLRNTTKLFGRKFETGRSDALLNRIDEELLC